MKVTATEVPPRQVALEIEVEQERLTSAVDEALRRFAQRVNVPGFRKGKAPRAMVERVVGRETVVQDALDHLVPQVVSQTIEQEKIEPYGRPRVESIELEPLRVRAVVPLAPRVELGDYTRLSAPRQAVSVSPEEVEAVVNRLRESHAQWVPVERPVQMGDRVSLDVRGEAAEGGRHVLDSTDAEYVVDAERPQPAPGFAEALLGMQAGDGKTFTLALSEDYRDRSLAGQPVRFSVKVHGVKERQLPEVDDAFAQQVGDYADTAAMRAAIEQHLHASEEARVRSQLEDAALDALVDVSTVEVPPQLIDHEAAHLAETFARNVEQQGLKLEQYLRLAGKDEQTFRDEVQTEAARRVRRSLALDAFAEAERIAVEEAEVAAEIRQAAAATAEAEATEALARGNATTVARVESALRARKALASLVERVTRAGAGNGASPGAPKSAPAERVASDTETEHETPAGVPAGQAEEQR